MHKQWGLRALDFHDTYNESRIAYDMVTMRQGHSGTWAQYWDWSRKFHQDTITGKKRSAAVYNPYSLCSQRHICMAYDKFTSLSRFISDAPFFVHLLQTSKWHFQAPVRCFQCGPIDVANVCSYNELQTTCRHLQLSELPCWNCHGGIHLSALHTA